MKKLFKPIFEKYHVNAYICGHDHNLQYIKPPGFTHYFVSGAGSEISKTVIHPEGGVFARSENGFMNIHHLANQLQVTVIIIQAQHLYSCNYFPGNKRYLMLSAQRPTPNAQLPPQPSTYPNIRNFVFSKWFQFKKPGWKEG